MKNLTAENRREFIRLSFEIVHEWNVHLEISSRPEADNLCLSEQMFYRKQSLGAPLILSKSKPSFLLSTKAQA